MGGIQKLGFFAYPDGYPIIGEAIEGAVQLAHEAPIVLKPWKAMQIVGFKLDDQVRANVAAAAVLIADITYPNMNVFYEMGHAIAIGKPVIPTVNVALDKAVQRVNQLGLFDTIGWASYANADRLFGQLQEPPESPWANTHTRRKNHSQPLFILDTQMKTDFRNQIFHAVENSHVQFRTFDPTEIPRLTAAQAIAEVSSSAGVIVPFISDELVDAERNNLRASFILGLCHGFEVEAMAIQYDNRPAPVDYRDFITNSTYKHETEKHVSEFAAKVLVWNQRASSRDRRLNLNLLSTIDLGSPMAENETGVAFHAEGVQATHCQSRQQVAQFCRRDWWPGEAGEDTRARVAGGQRQRRAAGAIARRCRPTVVSAPPMRSPGSTETPITPCSTMETTELL